MEGRRQREKVRERAGESERMDSEAQTKKEKENKGFEKDRRASKQALEVRMKRNNRLEVTFHQEVIQSICNKISFINK